MKKGIALACAGMLAVALTACSAPATTSSTTSETSTVSAATESASAETSASAAESAEVSADTAEEASAAASTEVSTSEETTGGTSTNAETETVTGDVENVTTDDAAGGTSVGTEDVAATQGASAGGVSVESGVAEELNSLLANGDFTGALEALEESGAAASPDNIGIENLTTSLQQLADAASVCNITKEPNSGNVIVYGDNATVIDGTTNAIPFVNMTHGYTHLQLGFVDRFDDPDGYHDAEPTSVDFTAGGQTWTWNVDTANSVTVPQDDARTWVLETAVDSADASLLTAAGESEGATVQFIDGTAGNLDYTLSSAETSAFSHIGTFVDALAQVRGMIGG